MTMEIYLDANATSPVLPAAIDAATAAMRDCFGNPSSSHAAGLRARALREAARAAARRVIGAPTGRVMFNSGATEGIQTAVLSALCAVRERRARGEACGELLLYGATEHKAVPESLAHWNRVLGTGLELRALPVDADGRHRLEILRELAPRAALVCTMAANNETGVVSDLAAIEGVLEDCASPALWMVDCVQALGKLPLDLGRSRIDYAPFSGHKLYAPKGIGMLYVREGAPYTPLMCGGGQEEGQRSGTENMAGIAAFGAVLEALERGDTFRTHAELLVCRERLVQALRAAFPDIAFNAPLAHALPTTLNFSVPGASSSDLLEIFDAAGVRVSAGSACSAAKAAPSHVLDAMGLPPGRSAAAVRLSFGPLVDDATIDAACAGIARCGRALALSVLAPSPLLGRPHGLVQLDAEGKTGWLLFDADARACIAIDPPAAQAARAAGMLRAGGYRLLAALHTGLDDAGAASLCRECGGAPGWPFAADAIAFGGERLGRVEHGAGNVYLFGAAQEPRFVFTGGCELWPELAQGGVRCGADSERPVAVSAAVPLGDEDMELDSEAALRLLEQYPDALVIDVRDLREHGAGEARLHGRPAHNLPLARLAEHSGHFLHGERRPLLFVCRSGARSLRAARVLRQLGRGQTWCLAGGLALMD
ncbi:aminotransferase class V-fold PLP-dependent enzyme [Massilia sp. ST3]|uniref:aminotransferase class V-fold PLP-dependent enzyme n=1 Tax=Massilia sp. ST3 TaxID=2824903 RepID=UPI001B843B20|nr:aminotransferase class V-fold PLP-dependent enzyme [Massilia sp. ST3]MBQ5946178.1 aminotransferase class V-fold PLP-dependent enzyme [Massilia sp. ST3]